MQTKKSKIISSRIRYLGSLPSVDTRFFMVVLSAVFSVSIACFRIGWRMRYWQLLFLFQKAKSDHGAGVSQINAYLDGNRNARIECDMRANYIGCFIPSIL